MDADILAVTGSTLQGIRELAWYQGGETEKRDNPDDVSYCRQYHATRNTSHTGYNRYQDRERHYLIEDILKKADDVSR